MRPETKRKQAKEITDNPRLGNDLIAGGRWDLLTLARRAEGISDDRFIEIAAYVVGERCDNALSLGGI